MNYLLGYFALASVSSTTQCATLNLKYSLNFISNCIHKSRNVLSKDDISCKSDINNIDVLFKIPVRYVVPTRKFNSTRLIILFNATNHYAFDRSNDKLS